MPCQPTSKYLSKLETAHALAVRSSHLSLRKQGALQLSTAQLHGTAAQSSLLRQQTTYTWASQQLTPLLTGALEADVRLSGARSLEEA
mmetsp:Transcript_10513/g.21373  ORF Transcript_10513/g.21373 Transcript_10513/m.21373 type:complete len:88 (-) Transcript_10513:235-498(-)